MPSPKEKECIEYAMAFREKMAEAEISRKKTTNKKTPIILTPKQFEQEIASDAFKAMRRLPFHKKVLLLFVFVILYLLYFPLYFLLGILDLFPDSKKSQRRIEEEIRKKYRIDYETSDVKT
ncbi:MAG: hypothetical protein KKD31_19050, partial [Bacteroidetes bacterium]|nr:hypothetical protein [Bacteroidota bacterium]